MEILLRPVAVKTWAAVFALPLVLFGLALWLAHWHVPSMSEIIGDNSFVEGSVVTADGGRYSVLPDGSILRVGPNGAERDFVLRVPAGLIRLAADGERLYVAYETLEGEPKLRQVAPQLGRSETLSVAASALEAGCTPGTVWIGGVNGSVERLQGGSRTAVQTTLPTAIRLLRYDEGGGRIVAISANGMRMSIDCDDTTLSGRLVEQDAVDTISFRLYDLLETPSEGDPFPVGGVFKECDECPEMVVIPGGNFVMGSPTSEAGRESNEGPQREVQIEKMAMGRYEVTFDEWDACVADGFCRAVENDEGWGRGRRPVVSVSQLDIIGEAAPEERGFLAWMNEKVEGTPYRLPSEAEWEYAARAGTTTVFAFGNAITADQANFGSNFEGGRTSQVGTYPANAFGLYDMHGNVWEWVEDCWHSTYQEAPADGSAWTLEAEEDCAIAVVRGGSWLNTPQKLRSADRGRSRREFRLNYFGFRLARTLPPN